MRVTMRFFASRSHSSMSIPGRGFNGSGRGSIPQTCCLLPLLNGFRQIVDSVTVSTLRRIRMCSQPSRARGNSWALVSFQPTLFFLLALTYLNSFKRQGASSSRPLPVWSEWVLAPSRNPPGPVAPKYHSPGAAPSRRAHATFPRPSAAQECARTFDETLGSPQARISPIFAAMAPTAHPIFRKMKYEQGPADET